MKIYQQAHEKIGFIVSLFWCKRKKKLKSMPRRVFKVHKKAIMKKLCIDLRFFFNTKINWTESPLISWLTPQMPAMAVLKLGARNTIQVPHWVAGTEYQGGPNCHQTVTAASQEQEPDGGMWNVASGHTLPPMSL